MTALATVQAALPGPGKNFTVLNVEATGERNDLGGITTASAPICNNYGTDCSYTGGTSPCQGLCYLVVPSGEDAATSNAARVDMDAAGDSLGWGIAALICAVFSWGCLLFVVYLRLVREA